MEEDYFSTKFSVSMLGCSDKTCCDVDDEGCRRLHHSINSADTTKCEMNFFCRFRYRNWFFFGLYKYRDDSHPTAVNTQV